MTREPKIPMRPEDLPQQRIHEVVELPGRPAEFNFAAGYGCILKDSLPETGISSATFLLPTQSARVERLHLSESNRLGLDVLMVGPE